MSLNELYKKHIETITDRARSALDDAGFDAVVIHAGGLQSKSPFDDMEWPFRPVPMFTYWTPVEWPDSAVVVGPGGPKLWAARATGFWERPAEPDWAFLAAGLEVEMVDHDAVADRVKASLPSGRIAFIGHETEPARALGLDAEAYNPSTLIDELEDGRVFKTDYEVAAMAEASLAGARGHRAAAERFMDGERSELALHLEYLTASGQDDADSPYKGIVALGDAAAILHHHTYQTRPGAGSLLIDAGARHQGYPCDITRTYVAPVDEGDAEAFGALLLAMDELQQKTIDDITVGMNYETLHDQCHERLARVLVEQGLVTCSAEAAVEEGITRALFPHGLGHSLGVQVHDVACRRRPPREDNAFLRNTRDIEPGQVFTIEPGVYFIDALLDDLRGKPAGGHVRWDAVEVLRPFGGIRIEDDIYVRPEGGLRNLTREAFEAI